MALDLRLQPQRPDIQRVKSTPGLFGPSYEESSERRRLSVASDDAIQKLVQSRSNDLYRHIRFAPNNIVESYRKRISFDTINVEYCQHEDDNWWLDDEAPHSKFEDYDFRGRERGRESLRIPSTSRSPSASPTRMRSPSREMDPSSWMRGRLNYPTTPIITHRGVNLTRVHRQYEDLYDGLLAKQGICPVLPHRVILVYISGRKHTWVALDWALRNLIEQGDSITIVAATNHRLAPAALDKTHFASPQRYPPKTAKVRLRQRSRPEYMVQIARNVMKYALSVINRNIIAKVTVEIVDSNTKDALKDMYRLYEPNIVCTGSKTNTKNSAPLKSWQSSRLSDRLVKNFPLPVIVVPALNLGAFESGLQTDLEGLAHSKIPKVREQSTEPSQFSEETISNKTTRDDDLESLLSENSETSHLSSVSSQSYDSFQEISGLYDDYKTTLKDRLAELEQNEINEEYFLNFARAISSQSLQFCEDLKGVDPDFRGRGAKLAKEITGANFFGGAPTKTKSLLDPIASPTGSSKTYEELKKTLTRNSRKSEGTDPNVPLVKVHSPPQRNKEEDARFNQAPKPSALKFADDQRPPISKKGLSDKKNQRQPESTTHRLKKFLSHEDRTDHGEVNLKPSNSHPEIRSGQDDGKKKKKSKIKKFWKFF